MNQLSLNGYIHNVTAVTQSRNGSSHYFNFLLQVDEARKRRAVCYDDTKHKLLKDYEDSKNPVRILNVKEKPSMFDPAEQHLILGRKSRIEPGSKTDVAFEYDTNTPQEQETPLTTIQGIQKLERNKLLTVKGTITLNADSVRDVIMKDGFLVPMLNRCTITDNSATIRLTLWGDLIQQVTNHSSYSITQVRIKTFDNAKYLTTTPSTTITPIEEHFTPPSAQLFQSLFDTETIFVDNIRLAEAFKTWLSCSKCQNLLTEEASEKETTIIKCPNCNAVQPLSSCATSASVRIGIRDSKYELVWLKAFTPIIQQILNYTSSDVTLNASEEDVYRQLFKVQNLTVSYSNTSNVIKEVHFQQTTDTN